MADTAFLLRLASSRPTAGVCCALGTRSAERLLLLLLVVCCGWCVATGVLLLVCFVSGEFKKKDKLAKPKPSHKGTVIYRLKPFKNQVSCRTLLPPAPPGPASSTAAAFQTRGLSCSPSSALPTPPAPASLQHTSVVGRTP